jgi:hypothetical protein
MWASHAPNAARRQVLRVGQRLLGNKDDGVVAYPEPSVEGAIPSGAGQEWSEHAGASPSATDPQR